MCALKRYVFGFPFSECHKTFIDYRCGMASTTFSRLRRPLNSTTKNGCNEANEQRPDERSFIHFRFACFVCIVYLVYKRTHNNIDATRDMVAVNERVSCDLCADGVPQSLSHRPDTPYDVRCTAIHYSGAKRDWSYPFWLPNIIIGHWYLFPAFVSECSPSFRFRSAFSSTIMPAVACVGCRCITTFQHRNIEIHKRPSNNVTVNVLKSGLLKYTFISRGEKNNEQT